MRRSQVSKKRKEGSLAGSVGLSPTLGFGSGQDLMGHGTEPCVRLCGQRKST